MRKERLKAFKLVPLCVVTLLSTSLAAQFKETYEAPGYLLEWGGYGSGSGQFDFPRGVAVDAVGNVYVMDTGNNRVQKFDSSGNFLTEWGSGGSGDGQFSGPWAVAVDGSGHVYVADSGNDRIQKFDSSGNFLTKWGSSGTGDGQFNSPRGVTADAYGNVYVVDWMNHEIQRFDSAGNFLIRWGSQGSGDGQFSSPGGVAADAFGNVYVADSANDRIQKFDSRGNFLTEWGTIGGQLYNPGDVAVDVHGSVYVADTNHHSLKRFDGAGNLMATWGSTGGGAGEFYFPRGVAVDDSGNIYVADTGNSFTSVNNRIEKFGPVLWFDVAGYDSYLSVTTQHETTAVRTLFQLENNGAPRFAFKNTNSDVEWSFQQSGPGNFLISREGTGGPEMQVFQNGRVRMGPGGTPNFDLDGGGNLKIKGGLTAYPVSWPDYVFAPGYELMSLPDLRHYIEQEKHLPNILSAAAVGEEGGHNMTELQVRLLEKIEELTLYILAQEREMEVWDRAIRKLESELKILQEELESERRTSR